MGGRHFGRHDEKEFIHGACDAESVGPGLLVGIAATRAGRRGIIAE